MLVRLETGLVMMGRVYDPGELVELPEHFARRLVETGQAVAIVASTPATPPETATMATAESTGMLPRPTLKRPRGRPRKYGTRPTHSAGD